MFYQGTNVEMLEETYDKFKTNILPKHKLEQSHFQEPEVEYCELQQVLDMCTYNHYPELDKDKNVKCQHNPDNDIYDTSKLEDEFEYGIYEDIVKTEELMAELKRIDEEEKEQVKYRNIKFDHFPLEQFAEVGKVYDRGDPHLKADAETELFEFEMHTCNDKFVLDKEKSKHNTESQNIKVSHVQPVGETHELDSKGNIMTQKSYGPVYIPYKTDRKLKENEYLENKHYDTETFQYSHEASTKQIMVQGVYIGSTSPLVADIKTQQYSVIHYAKDGYITKVYNNTHEIPVLVDNGSTLNIMPTYYYEKAYYLHHLPKEKEERTIHTGNGTVKTHFWIDVPINIEGCFLQLKLLVCDTQAKAGILLSKMALEQLQRWQDYSAICKTNSLTITCCARY